MARSDEAVEVVVVEAEHIGGAMGAAGEETHDRKGGDRFAAAGFADQAVSLASADSQDTPRTAAIWYRR